MAQVYDNRWKIEKPLGEGGQAYTYLVSDQQDTGETLYVLKRLKNIKRLERFKREIEAIQKLSHKNIVDLIDFNLEGNRPYLVTEYCSNGSLDKAYPFWHDSPVIALHLFLKILAGIEYAHSMGIVHRDIKPGNIFLREDNSPVIGDFGISYFEDGERLTLTREAVGPKLYIAPELEDGRLASVTAKSDIYSLGKVLYWLLSKGRVFSRERHREQSWDLKVKNMDLRLGWENIYMEHINRILDHMIILDPGKRFTTFQARYFIREAIRLIKKEFNPVSPQIPQPCYYCGIGQYQLRAKDDIDVRNFGFKTVGAPDWRILLCSACGHMQAFRIESISRKDWWENS